MLVHDVGHSSPDGAPNDMRKTVRTMPVQERAWIDHLIVGNESCGNPARTTKMTVLLRQWILVPLERQIAKTSESRGRLNEARYFR
jgi:hypothetical protein